MVKVTTRLKRVVYVNPKYIIVVEGDDTHKAIIDVASGNEVHSFYVVDKAEDIVKEPSNDKN